MVAGAVLWARHLAVTSVVVAAVAERKAVRLIGAQEVFRGSFHQRHKRPVVGVEKLAIDRFEICDQWEAEQRVFVVDGLEPGHVAIAADGVAAEKDARLEQDVGGKSESVSVDYLQLVDGQVDLFQLRLLEERVRPDGLDDVVVQEKSFDVGRNILRPHFVNFVEAGVDVGQLDVGLDVEVVLQPTDRILEIQQSLLIQARHSQDINLL